MFGSVSDGQRLRPLLTAILSGDRYGPGSWDLLRGRIKDLDALSPFELTALPLLLIRWQEQGCDLDGFPVLRGLRRKMIVRNRLVLNGARAAMGQLQSTGIDVLPLKGVGLLGRGLPETGLRAFGDADLWVRPSQFNVAYELFRGPGQRLSHGRHAGMTRDPLGRELDLHILPSHIFVRRRSSRTDAEALFDRCWQRRTGSEPSLADLIYLSFLNPLYSHAPGEVRAAFALIEFNAVLNHPDVSDSTLKGVVANAIADRTLSVFVEHLDWLGLGVSPVLDRFRREVLEPVLTGNDQVLRRWTAELHQQTAFDWMLANELRHHAHSEQSPPLSASRVTQSMLQDLLQVIRLNPLRLVTWLGRRSSWQRLWNLTRGVISLSRSPIAPEASTGNSK